MGVNKDLVDKIGMFDTIFGKGYGEENDFCQRAIKAGYKNIHITNLFIYHKHGGSFPSETKKRLIEQNYTILCNKFPNYESDIKTCIQEDKLKILREYMQIQLDFHFSSHKVLIFDHNLGGGANDYTQQNIQKRRKIGEAIFLIKYDWKETKSYFCEFYVNDKIFKIIAKTLSEIDEIFKLFDFDEIFVNSLVSYDAYRDTIMLIEKNVKTKNAKLIIPLHDYFPICPNYVLLDHNSQFCNIPEDIWRCRECLANNENDFKQFNFIPDIKRWRLEWSSLFKLSTEVIAFSSASAKIFKKVYPEHINKLKIIPHNISGRYENIYDKKLSLQSKRVIGILGGINIPKGALVIKDIVKYIEENSLDAKIILIGEISEHIESPYFYKTGRYQISELPALVKKLEITEFLIPSIWPETFSYTTDEIMQLGYPLTVFDIGAPAERVAIYENGRVIPMDDWKKLFEGVL